MHRIQHFWGPTSCMGLNATVLITEKMYGAVSWWGCWFFLFQKSQNAEYAAISEFTLPTFFLFASLCLSVSRAWYFAKCNSIHLNNEANYKGDTDLFRICRKDLPTSHHWLPNKHALATVTLSVIDRKAPRRLLASKDSWRNPYAALKC